jgi:hypothetical protein
VAPQAVISDLQLARQLVDNLLADERRGIALIAAYLDCQISDGASGEGDAMRYLTGVGLLLALLMGPAYSQTSPDWGPNEKDVAQKAEASRRTKDLERDYNEVTKRTAPTTKVSTDPWQSIRSSGAAAKPKQ